MLTNYRPSGVLLRTLRLDRWLCPECSRDNLVRRDSSVLWRPCRWCDAELVTLPVVITSIGEAMARAFNAMGEAARAAGKMLAQCSSSFSDDAR
jgi:ribosomal protein L37AE/L43A